MKETIIISMITIATLSLAACGKKEAAGVVVTAQDTGKDTTTSELVKGDSAGEKTSSGTQKTVTEKTTAAENGIDWEKYGETMFLGEWTCDNGETWIIDNGYNLTIKSESFDEDKIGSWGYGADALTITIWNDKTQIEVNTFDEDGEITGTEIQDYVGETSHYYEVEKFSLDDNTHGSLILKDESEKEIKLTLDKRIEYSNNTVSYTENKLIYEEKLAEIEEEQERQEIEALGINYDEYKEKREAEKQMRQKLREEAEAAGMDYKSYVDSLGGEEVLFNHEH